VTNEARNKIIFVSISDVSLVIKKRILYGNEKSENLWKTLLQTLQKKYLTL